jgi:hypothetical protein
MSTTPQPIYPLLPAVYRSRDDLLGNPLAAFYSVLESQYGIVKDNLLQLYDDQFIETCAPWVIPYIGALIGYDPVYTVTLAGADSRAEVANTIGYRRRKGTLMAMEQLTQDVSGRATTAVEEFRRLITTLSLRDVRKHHNATANLRRGRDWEDQWGPFTRLNRTVDVRSIAPRNLVPPPPATNPPSPDTTPLEMAIHGPGRFNIPDVAVWMWRWQRQNQNVTNAPAFSLASAGNSNGYLFSSLGGPIPLFQVPIPETAPFSRLVTEGDVPEPIRRRRFAARLGDFYPTSLQLVADGTAVPVSEIMCANLEPGPGGELCTVPAGMIAIDPCLGRIQYAAGMTLPTQLLVSYNYGSAANIGGGPYDRTASIAQQASGGFQAIVSSTLTLPGYTVYANLQAAVAAWNLLPAGSTGIIVLPNFESISGIDLTGANAISIPSQSQLLIASSEVSTSSVQPLWDESCVTLFGSIEVTAPPAPLNPDGLSQPMGSLQISGVWLSGAISVTGAACVQLTDCTLVPGISLNPDGSAAQPGTPSVTGTAIGATLCLTRTISGPISLPASCSVRICDSIVDAGSASSPALLGPAGSAGPTPGAELHIEDSTVIGKVYAQAIRLASNTIFRSALAAGDTWSAAVWANRTQAGCVRFCSLPFNSIVPRRYECLPPNAASEQALAPQFVSLRFGNPAYCLLSGECPVAVWKGADNGSQMGVFLQIQETEAVANIQIRANEYLVANLQCGVFLIPSHELCGDRRETLVGVNPIPPFDPGPVGRFPFAQPMPAEPQGTQPTPATPIDAEPNVDAQPAPAQTEDTQQAPAAAETAPKPDAEPEPPKAEESQPVPVASAETGPTENAAPDLFKPYDPQLASDLPAKMAAKKALRKSRSEQSKFNKQSPPPANGGSTAEPEPATPELNGPQMRDEQSEGKDPL